MDTHRYGCKLKRMAESLQAPMQIGSCMILILLLEGAARLRQAVDWENVRPRNTGPNEISNDEITSLQEDLRRTQATAEHPMNEHDYMPV